MVLVPRRGVIAMRKQDPYGSGSESVVRTLRYLRVQRTASDTSLLHFHE